MNSKKDEKKGNNTDPNKKKKVHVNLWIDKELLHYAREDKCLNLSKFLEKKITELKKGEFEAY